MVFLAEYAERGQRKLSDLGRYKPTATETILAKLNGSQNNQTNKHKALKDECLNGTCRKEEG